MLELIVLLTLMLGGDFSNYEEAVTPEMYQQVYTLYEERYEEIQEANANLNKVRGNIFVGDDRFIDIDKDCNITDKENNFLVAEEGADLTWLKMTGLAEIEEIVKENKDVDEWTLVMNLGMYDFYSAYEYTELYNTLAEDYNICCVTVMPVDNEIDSFFSLNTNNLIMVDNDNIKMFNNCVNSYVSSYSRLTDKQSDKKVWMLSLYTMLETNGYTTDESGVLYDEETNKYVYDFISMCLDTYYLPCQP